MRSWAAVLVAGLLLVPGAAVADDGIAGHWKMTILEDGSQVTYWLLSLEEKGGKLTGSAEPLNKVPPTALNDPKVSGDLLGYTLKVQKGPTFHFEGRLPKAQGRKILGSLERDGMMIPAFMERTLAKNAFELERNMLTRTPNDPRVFGAAVSLARQAKEKKVPAKEVREWVETALRSADNYGPRWRLDVAQQLVEVLKGKDAYPEVAVAAARQAEKMMTATTPLETRLRLLTALGSALKNAGKVEQTKEVNQRIDKLENVAYKEYSAKALEFPLAKYTGRRAKSDRTVLVELFTGAQCPPCVGADLAFDALGKTFNTKEVVLLEYHLHVPQPDALTNTDTEARAEYYGDEKVRGTPTVLFDGKVSPIGGGSREDAPDVYKDYRKITETLLEAPAGAQIQAGAAYKAGKIYIKAAVRGLAKPGDKMKLRLALVEDWARYKGHNGISYFHQVVRAFPGGAAGFTLAKKDAEQNVVIDLRDLRDDLTKYLDRAGKDRTFLDSQRPMRLRNLSVVAFVQNDATREVLQAAQVPVTGE